MKKHSLPFDTKWTCKDVAGYLNLCLQERFPNLGIEPFTSKDKRLTNDRLDEIARLVSRSAMIIYNQVHHQITKKKIANYTLRYWDRDDYSEKWHLDHGCMRKMVETENEYLEAFFGKMYVEQEGFYSCISHPSEQIRNYAVSLYRKEEKQRIKNLPRAERRLLRQGKV